MAQQAEKGIQKGDSLQKIAGVSFILGSILMVVGNALLPRNSDPTDIVEIIQQYADNAGGLTEILFLIIGLGTLGTLFGFAGVFRAITSGAAAAWVRIGFYGFIVGTAMFVGLAGLFGLGFSAVAKEWDSMAAGADKAAMFQGFNTIYWMLSGALSMTIVVYWTALAIIFTGVVMSTTYPKWLGWAGLITSGVAIVIGFVYAFAEPTQGLGIAFGVAFSGSTLWALSLGIVTVRRAW